MTSSAKARDDWLLPLRPPEECRILVVDDEPEVVEILSFFLRKQGYQVLSAEDGKQALKRVQKEMPDVVVMDVMMPEMDGIEVCRRLKRSAATRFLPVVIMTAKGDTATRIECKEAGADDFLDKPVNELELMTRMRILLRAKQLYEQVQDSNRELEKRVSERTAELQSAFEKLEEADLVKTNIISNVSHELRTPLQHIKSAVALLALEDLPKSQAEMVNQTVNVAIESLVRLVNDMISLSEGSPLRIERVALRDVIHEAVAQVSTVHKSRAEDIRAEVAEGLPPVMGDGRALTRVIYHLADNAIKFSRDGCDVLVSAKEIPEKRVRVTVQDKGIGIAEDEHKRVFAPFYQVDGSPTRRYEGAGLGLALVKLILDGHRVDVHLESKEGQGSTFWFDLEVASID